MITITEKELNDKLELIKNNISRIKAGINEDTPPIFVELIGTPKSGKTTLLRSLKSLFYNNQMEIFTRRETAEYNPVEKGAKQYDLWMVLELFRNLSEDISNKHGQIVIYDRGIIDRLVWLENALENGKISKQDLDRIKGLYNLETIREEYKPITLGFLTSPELSVQRKGSAGRFVNNKTLGAYNRIFMENQGMIAELSSNYTLTKTDSYQGRIEEFIMDMSINLTERIVSQLEVSKNKKGKDTVNCEQIER